MAGRRMEFTADQIALAKWEYEETDKPVQQIADGLGCAKTTFFRLVKEQGFKRRLLRALPLRQVDPADNDVPTAPTGDAAAAMRARLMGIVQCTVGTLENAAQTANGEDSAAQAERISRVASSLARTVQDLTRLRTPAEAPTTQPHGRDDDDDLPPRHPDEFRRELARRIEAFVARESDAGLPDQPE